MKTAKIVFLPLALASLVLVSCFSPWTGDAAVITLNFGGGLASGRSATFPDYCDNIESELVHTVVLSSGEVLIAEKRDIHFGDEVSFLNIASGTSLDIRVTATLYGAPYAQGHDEILVKPGPNNRDVKMQPLDAVNNLLKADFFVEEGELVSELSLLTLQDGYHHTFVLNGPQTLTPQTLAFDESVNKTVSITLKGVDGEPMPVSFDQTQGSGSMFTIGKGVTLILEDVFLSCSDGTTGFLNNTDSLVTVESGGRLVMKNGAQITGNTAERGGGVYVHAGGSFSMEGGEIWGNYATVKGGGVYVKGLFVMTGEETGIFDNHAINGSDTYSGQGGGVAVEGEDSLFFMTDGYIQSNTALLQGGGVHVYEGNFTKTGGTIYGQGSQYENQAEGGDNPPGKGHAVYVNIDEKDGTPEYGWYHPWDQTIARNKGLVITCSPFTWKENGGIPIASVAELQQISSNLNGNYVLEKDLIISGAWTPLGTSSSNPFTGIFDGNGKTITFGTGNNPFTITTTGDGHDYAGLFGRIDTGMVMNLKLTGFIHQINDNGKSELYAGAVAGYNAGGTIKNVSSGVSMENIRDSGTNHVGGIAGVNDGTIINCISEGVIESNDESVGGIAGTNKASIFFCWVPSDGVIAGSVVDGYDENCVVLSSNNSNIERWNTEWNINAANPGEDNPWVWVLDTDDPNSGKPRLWFEVY